MLGEKEHFPFKILELWDQVQLSPFLITITQLCQGTILSQKELRGSCPFVFLLFCVSLLKLGQQGYFLFCASDAWKQQIFGMRIPESSDSGCLLITHSKKLPSCPPFCCATYYKSCIFIQQKSALFQTANWNLSVWLIQFKQLLWKTLITWRNNQIHHVGLCHKNSLNSSHINVLLFRSRSL